MLRFPFIKKTKKKIQSWKANVLSQAGRHTLVKYVVSSLSVYNMSILQLPDQILESLDKMMRRFWWGDGVNKKKSHTIKWSELSKPIEEGVWALENPKRTF